MKTIDTRTPKSPRGGRRHPLAAAVVLAGALGTGQGAVAQGEGDGAAAEAARSAYIDGRLEATYALNPHLNPFDIDVGVDTGVVTLKGTVPTDVDRELAEVIAGNVEGVERVRNQIEVREGPPQAVAGTAEARTGADRSGKREPSDGADATLRSYYQFIQDATTSARVRLGLLANGVTEGLTIDVATQDGRVTLQGNVDTEEERALAERVARNASERIDSVRNQLRIASSR